MTGFAQSEVRVAGIHYRFELRTLNHRFQDVKLRLPKEWNIWETSIRSLLQSRLFRGSIDLRAEMIKNSAEPASQYQINIALAAHYYEGLMALQKTLGLSDAVGTRELLTFPDVVYRTDLGSSSESLGEQSLKEVLGATQQLLDQLIEMRRQEGVSIVKSIRKTTQETHQIMDWIIRRRKECQEEYSKKIETRIKAAFQNYAVLGSTGVQQALMEGRLAQELALLLERTDVQEEISRFQEHLQALERELNQAASGKKIEFLLQELSREGTTLGNKAQDAQMGQKIVDLKLGLEQMREQVLNLE